MGKATVASIAEKLILYCHEKFGFEPQRVSYALTFKTSLFRIIWTEKHEIYANVHDVISCNDWFDLVYVTENLPIKAMRPGRGTLNFFSGRGVRPGFLKCGACELIFASEKGGLWTEHFQVWGLVNWKFPNLGACELKISKFWGLWAKIWVKIEAVEAKISKFSQKRCCELTLLHEKGPLGTTGEAWKGVFRAAHPHTLFLGQCSPDYAWQAWLSKWNLNLNSYCTWINYIQVNFWSNM